MNFKSLTAAMTVAMAVGIGVSLSANAQGNASGATEYIFFEDDEVDVVVGNPSNSSNSSYDYLDDEESIFSNSSSQDLLAVPGGGWDDDWLEKQQAKSQQGQAVIDDLENMYQTDHLWQDGSPFKEDVLRTTGAYIYGGAAAIESMTGGLLPLTETDFVQEQRDTAVYGPEWSPYREHYGDSESRDNQAIDQGFDQLFDGLLDF